MSNSKTEYIISEEKDKMIDFDGFSSNSSLPSSVLLKRVGKFINGSIKTKSNEKLWPPTPEDIITTKYDVNRDLYNLLSWIIFPKGQLGDNGIVKLPSTKVEKVLQITQNIEPLLPNAKPSLDQTLLSLTIHRKTGSSNVVDTLHKLGYGISYTETVFIEDKWAEWAESQSSIIPSNIKPGIPTTMVADNIDWENKSLTGQDQTHNTNSILIQNDTHDDNLLKSPVSLKATYNFNRK